MRDEDPSIKIWAGGKDLSSFILVRLRMPIFPQTKSFSSSNLSSKESILRLPKVNLIGFLILRTFKRKSCEMLFQDKSKLESEFVYWETCFTAAIMSEEIFKITYIIQKQMLTSNLN